MSGITEEITVYQAPIMAEEAIHSNVMNCPCSMTSKNINSK